MVWLDYESGNLTAIKSELYQSLRNDYDTSGDQEIQFRFDFFAYAFLYSTLRVSTRGTASTHKQWKMCKAESDLVGKVLFFSSVSFFQSNPFCHS